MIASDHYYAAAKRLTSISKTGLASLTSSDFKFLLKTARSAIPVAAFDPCTAEGKLCRPTGEWKDLFRWTGKSWKKDDGEPGLAFAGMLHYAIYPGDCHSAYIAGKCGCHRLKCPRRVAGNYTSKKYGGASGYDFPS